LSVLSTHARLTVGATEFGSDGITLPVRLPETAAPNVVHVPQYAPTTSHPAKSAGSKGVASVPGSRITERKTLEAGPPRGGGQPQKGATVKKKELIERIAEKADVSRSEAQRYFEAFEEVVTEALKAGQEVQITGFGKFSVKERKAREGRNPQTGQKMKIAAQKVPAFSAGNALKEAV
jgi:DNA-binding protein HU-beta